MISIYFDRVIDCLSSKLHITDGRHGGGVKQTSLYESRLSLNKLEESPSSRELPLPMRFLSFAVALGFQFFRHMVLEFKLMVCVG